MYKLILLILLLSNSTYAGDCSKSWGLLSNTFSGAKVDKAWDYTKGSKDIVVAVIDTGVDINHPSLQTNLWINKKEIPGNNKDDDGNGFTDDIHGWDFYNESGKLYETGLLGHGTHIAGIIGGKASQGFCGLNQDVSLMVLNYAKPDPREASTFLRNRENLIQNIALSIRYAVDNGANIINLSLSGQAPYKLEEEAIKYARDKGVLVVVASGNTSQNTDRVKSYPADYDLDNIISVAAVDQTGRLPYFSNWGKTSVDLLAPGFDIYSTLPEGRFGMMSGTSQATAFVSGALALIKAKYPDEDYKFIKQKLLDNVSSSPFFKDKAKASGNLNVLMAVQSENANIKEIMASKKLSHDEIADKEGNLVKDTSCTLCGSSRILCGAIDTKISDYSGETVRTTSLVELCATKNQRLLIKEELESMNEAELSFYALKNEIYSMAASPKDRELLLKNGFSLSSLIKNLGWDAYNKLRSIYLLVPALSMSDYSKRSKKTDNLLNHYSQYLEDLINTPSPHLKHEGYGLFVNSVHVSPSILERLQALLPIQNFFTYQKPTKISVVANYKLGKTTKKNDQPLLKEIAKTIELPTVKDVTEMRKAVYLKLNEHHLKTEQVAMVLPKNLLKKNKDAVVEHYRAVLNEPVKLTSSRGSSNASYKPTVYSKRMENLIQNQVKKAGKAANEQNRLVRRFESKAKGAEVFVRSSFKIPQVREEIREEKISARAFVRKNPNYLSYVNEKNFNFLSDRARQTNEVKRVTARRIKPIRNNGGPSVSTLGPMLAAQKPKTQESSLKAWLREKEIQRQEDERIEKILDAGLPPKEKPIRQRLEEQRRMIAEEGGKRPPEVNLPNIHNVFETQSITCESNRWSQMVYANYSSRFSIDEKCAPKTTAILCGKGHEGREFTKDCVDKEQKVSSCYEQISSDVASICKQYVKMPVEVTSSDLMMCAEVMSALACNKIPCDLREVKSDRGLIKHLEPELYANGEGIFIRDFGGERLATIDELNKLRRLNGTNTFRSVYSTKRMDIIPLLNQTSWPLTHPGQFVERLVKVTLYFNNIMNQCNFKQSIRPSSAID